MSTDTYCPTAEQKLEHAVFLLWETGMSWEEIAIHTGRPLHILLGYPEINDLYNK